MLHPDKLQDARPAAQSAILPSCGMRSVTGSEPTLLLITRRFPYGVVTVSCCVAEMALTLLHSP